MARVERLGGVGWGRGAGEEVGPAGVWSSVGAVGSRLGGLTDVEVGVWIITLWGDCGASWASSWDGEGGEGGPAGVWLWSGDCSEGGGGRHAKSSNMDRLCGG